MDSQGNKIFVNPETAFVLSQEERINVLEYLRTKNTIKLKTAS